MLPGGLTESVVADPALPIDAGPQGPAEGSLEDLYEHAPCGYLSTTAGGAVLKVNATFLDWMGCDRDAVLGRRFIDLLTVGSRTLYETRCEPILRLSGRVDEVALTLRRSDGSLLSVLVNSAVRQAVDGRAPTTRFAVFDATGRQDYERNLLVARRAAERSERRLRVLQQASATLAAAASAAAAAAAVAEVARVAFDATSATYMALDDHDGRTVLRSVVTGSHPLGDTVPFAASRPEAEAIRGGTVVALSDAGAAEAADPELGTALDAARLEAMVAAPLVGDSGDPLGVLVCFFGRRRTFADEDVELLEALARQAAQVLERIRLQDQVSHMAQHDPLTGLVNRKILHERLTAVLRGAAGARPTAVLFLDLDGFKAINDRLGHAVGDAVLVEVAARLRRAVRRTDTVARFGGDEFVVACEDIGVDGALRIADAIGKAVRQPIDGVPNAFPLTASIGVAGHRPGPGPAPGSDELVLLADQAMYLAKRGGKDRHVAVTA